MMHLHMLTPCINGFVMFEDHISHHTDDCSVKQVKLKLAKVVIGLIRRNTARYFVLS